MAGGRLRGRGDVLPLPQPVARGTCPAVVAREREWHPGRMVILLRLVRQAIGRGE